MKKSIKRTLMIGGGIAAVAAVGIIGFVYGHKPKPGIPCPRSLVRADGVPKTAFNSAPRANLQCIVQLVYYSIKNRKIKIYYPYEMNGKFYTGSRNIRPAKSA